MDNQENNFNINLNIFSVGVVNKLRPKVINEIADNLKIVSAYRCARYLYLYIKDIFPNVSHTVVFEPQSENIARVIVRYYGESHNIPITHYHSHDERNIMTESQEYTVYIGKGKSLKNGQLYQEYMTFDEAFNDGAVMLETLKSLGVKRAWIRITSQSIKGHDVETIIRVHPDESESGSTEVDLESTSD